MEENQYGETRKKRNRKKRLRKRRTFFTFILLLVIAIVGYSIFQYQSGLKLAKQENDEQSDIEFTGDDELKTVTNYLIIGVDSRGEEKSRSDTMMLLSRNKETNEIKLVSFMRDIYAEIPGYKSYKLNTAYYLGGVQLLKDTLNTMFDIPVHHYAIIDFESFESLIDILAPNGIEIDVEKDMSEQIGVTLTQGVHDLNGKELLGYARFRQDAEGDFGRVERQQKVIEALKDELLAPSNIKNLPKLVGATQGYITTDLSKADELKTVLSIVAKGTVTMEKQTIPVEGTYSFSRNHAGEVIMIDKEENKKLLHEFLRLPEE